MLEFFRQLVTGVAQTWRRLSISARVQLALAALITIALVAGATILGGQAQYGRLYARLDLDEANEIQVWLTDNDIPFRIRDGGTAIDIPVREIARARVSLAAQDLPKSQGNVPGFELFDTRDLMTNKYLQDVDYMRALQGELQRQLNQYDFVRNSYVFIREAPDELFVGEQKPSQATVTLDTNGKITPMQVKAVLHTVSSFGGANLSEQNIAVMDTAGTVLHGISEDEFASLASDQLEVKAAYEKHAEGKIRDVFRDLGVKAVISVSAVIDWTSEEVSDTKTLDGTVISSLKDDTTVRDIQPVPQGAPGAVANIPEELGPPGEEGIITETKQKIDNFEPSQTLTKTLKRPGRLTQYKVAAFVDPGVAPVLGADGQPVLDANGQAQMQPKTFTPQQLTQFEAYIRNAVGASDTVETDVVVAAQPIEIDRLTMAPPTVLPGTPWSEAPWFNWTWRVGLVLFFFLLIRFLMRRALVIPTAEEEEVIEIPEASPSERRAQEIAAEVERLSQQEPDTVAALLRTWMSED